tara:strand:- start:52 stop:231 length:180 start_codon:yes stop_codon:yes gene_type:complete
MKRYRVRTREIWYITREVDAPDAFQASLDSYDDENAVVKREFEKFDPYDETNTIKEIQK